MSKRIVYILINLVLICSSGCNNSKRQIENAKKYLQENKAIIESIVSSFNNDTVPCYVLKSNYFDSDNTEYLFSFNDCERFKYDVKDKKEGFINKLSSILHDSAFVYQRVVLISNIFELCRKTRIYCINNGPDNYVEFMLNPRVESILHIPNYKTSKPEKNDKFVFKPEKTKGMIFQKLEGCFYYYYIPR
jgi:hypothetical protein